MFNQMLWLARPANLSTTSLSCRRLAKCAAGSLISPQAALVMVAGDSLAVRRFFHARRAATTTEGAAAPRTGAEGALDGHLSRSGRFTVPFLRG